MAQEKVVHFTLDGAAPVNILYPGGRESIFCIEHHVPKYDSKSDVLKNDLLTNNLFHWREAVKGDFFALYISHPFIGGPLKK